MFILTTISDLIQISPEDFSKSSATAIIDNINAKYANKVIQNIGLCMGVYDLLESSDGLIGHGTGLVNVNGGEHFKFRMIVFRPFRGEIVLGKITSGSEKGIKISLEFFNDILVPPSLLLDGARFDYTDQVWVWDTEDGSTLYFDIGETVRFRVEAEEWHDQIPDAPTDLEGKTASERKPAYSIIRAVTITVNQLQPCRALPSLPKQMRQMSGVDRVDRFEREFFHRSAVAGPAPRPTKAHHEQRGES
ncbi:DNA-directed RNA polymerase III subunit rpc25 [Ascosphaera atra]|nr:DNA-directed RNA polymerase III subunit rpc25 [Ascosphaera atra]